MFILLVTFGKMLQIIITRNPTLLINYILAFPRPMHTLETGTCEMLHGVKHANGVSIPTRN